MRKPIQLHELDDYMREDDEYVPGEEKRRKRGYDWWMYQASLTAKNDERLFKLYCGEVGKIDDFGRGILCRRTLDNDGGDDELVCFCRDCHYVQRQEKFERKLEDAGTPFAVPRGV